MDLTDKLIINGFTDSISAKLSENLAEIIANLLKQEVLDIQKYRVDKEFEIRKQELDVRKQELELEEYKLNYSYKSYCKTHRQFMKKVDYENKNYLYYQCQIDGCNNDSLIENYSQGHGGEVRF